MSVSRCQAILSETEQTCDALIVLTPNKLLNNLDFFAGFSTALIGQHRVVRRIFLTAHGHSPRQVNRGPPGGGKIDELIETNE